MITTVFSIFSLRVGNQSVLEAVAATLPYCAGMARATSPRCHPDFPPHSVTHLGPGAIMTAMATLTFCTRARFYRNDGGKFVEVRQFFGVVNGKITWGDVNGDGRPDLLYSGTHGVDTIARLYLNLGNNQFIEAPLPSGGIILPGSTLVDWDN